MEQNNICPGSNRTWGAGTGNAICRECHRGWRSLGLNKRPIKANKHHLVPIHQRRKASD